MDKKSTNIEANGQICSRLKQERKKKRLNQTDYAALGGVTLRTQSTYEKGTRSPDTVYLQNISIKAGADIQYIITGFPSKLDRGEIDAQLLIKITKELTVALSKNKATQEFKVQEERVDLYTADTKKEVFESVNNIGLAVIIYNRVSGIDDQAKRDEEITHQVEFTMAVKRNEDLL